MALVTFNENVDHYVKGDVVDLDADELKRVDAYAKNAGVEKPYVKGAKKVETTKGETTQESAARTTGKDVEEKQANDTAVEVEQPADDGSEEKAAETDEATELPPVDDEPATDEGDKPNVVKK